MSIFKLLAVGENF